MTDEVRLSNADNSHLDKRFDEILTELSLWWENYDHNSKAFLDAQEVFNHLQYATKT